ncbi:RNA-guided endonuclease InsQ/TnpB family protein [Micromonospora sediminicola]|uniref:RNA-guided endonuclease InsQ/TnpB family protein n=1 Tax=Micromonospora sediminicola TaxID=946078 RepID=UPI0037ADFCEC
MRRTFKFLIRPTARQESALAAMLADHCDLYNAALEERRAAWIKRRVNVSCTAQQAQLPAIRAADPDQARWGFSSQQATVRRVYETYAAFFRRAKAGNKAGLPRFKARARFNTVTWPSNRDGCRWDSTPGGQTRVYLQGVGHVRVHAHRQVQGRVKTLTVTRRRGRWFLALSCDEVPAAPLPSTGRSVGIDLGVASLVTTSAGYMVGNPRFERTLGPDLAAAQAAIARCQRGSRRRETWARKAAALWAKAAAQRADHHHKLALRLIRDHDLIVHEDLRPENMARRSKSSFRRARSGLSRSIYDAGWGGFLRMLRDKAESAGRAVVAVNAAYTSRRCGSCGHSSAENRPSQAVFRCVSCGHEAHADVNAAINILRAGLVLRDAVPAMRKAAPAAESHEDVIQPASRYALTFSSALSTSKLSVVP